jgi:hypothetical protein
MFDNLLQYTRTQFSVSLIVIKPDPGVHPAKGLGPEFHGSTREN